MSDDEITRRRAEDARRARELRERRNKAKLRQITFWIRMEDEDAARKVMSDLSDRAWLALYEAGVIEPRDDAARAAEIKQRLAATSPPPAPLLSQERETPAAGTATTKTDRE